MSGISFGIRITLLPLNNTLYSLRQAVKKRVKKETFSRSAWDPFLEAPGNTGPIKLFCFPFQMGISKGLKRVPAFLEALILKYDFGLVKLPGLSRNGPQGHIGRW